LSKKKFVALASPPSAANQSFSFPCSPAFPPRAKEKLSPPFESRPQHHPLPTALSCFAKRSRLLLWNKTRSSPTEQLHFPAGHMPISPRLFHRHQPQQVFPHQPQPASTKTNSGVALNIVVPTVPATGSRGEQGKTQKTNL